MSKKPAEIYAPVGNYYGTPYVTQKDTRYFLVLEDWSGKESVEVSKAFYERWCAEFKNEATEGKV